MSQTMQNPKNKFTESVEDAREIGSEEQNRDRDWGVRGVEMHTFKSTTFWMYCKRINLEV